jgi:hypothetical protein
MYAVSIRFLVIRIAGVEREEPEFFDIAGHEDIGVLPEIMINGT